MDSEAGASRRADPNDLQWPANLLLLYEEVVLRLGLWGAKAIPEARPDDVVTADTLILALRSTFRPEAARDLRAGYELRSGDVVVHASVDHGALEVDEGPLADPDLVLETDVTLHPLLTGEVSPSEAI